MLGLGLPPSLLELPLLPTHPTEEDAQEEVDRKEDADEERWSRASKKAETLLKGTGPSIRP